MPEGWMRGGGGIIGVDEVGRGPLAGPVAVGAIWFSPGFDLALLEGVRDSKHLSEGRREEWSARAGDFEKTGMIRTAIMLATAEEIDTHGLSRVMKVLIERAVRKLAPKPAEGLHILLDGSLHAPPEYSQETVIHGDAIHPEISLASIVAKVHRDRLMVAFAEQYPEYGFEQHKGYGTRAHLEAITQHGLSPVHRRTFCRNYKGVL